jgi:hypothetical protein
MRWPSLSSHGVAHSLEHLVAGAASVASRRLQAPTAHPGPILNQVVEYGSSNQSAIISGFQLSAIFGKPFPAKAAAPSIPIEVKRSPLSRAFVLRRLSNARPFTGSIARAGPASETLHDGSPHRSSLGLGAGRENAVKNPLRAPAGEGGPRNAGGCGGPPISPGDAVSTSARAFAKLAETAAAN